MKMHPLNHPKEKMKRRISYFFTLLIILSARFSACNALDCNLNLSDPKQIAYTITVDTSGQGNFTTIQSAIDSIPAENNQWIKIQISSGIYKEKVTVPAEKPCLFFQGTDRNSTSIEWDDSEDSLTSATATFLADNILVTGISFKNTYNYYMRAPPTVPWKQALAARIDSDRVAFYDCAFYGIQDTLSDRFGRHHIKNCYIEGAVDFIFGDARSIYENCELYVNIGRYVVEPGKGGWITAEANDGGTDPGAFVFLSCVVNGEGKTRLGRAWRAYATVIFAYSNMSDVVDPEGWDPADYIGHESNFTFVEYNNVGPGSDMSGRVPWIKKLGPFELLHFTQLSFINVDGWIQKLPL